MNKSNHCPFLDGIIKPFIAGSTFPFFILPILYLILYCCSATANALHTNKLYFIPMFIPFLFGAVNLVLSKIEFICSESNKIFDEHTRLWVAGIILGLIVGLFAVNILNIPGLLFNITGSAKYLFILLIPFLYGIIFRYIVNYLNQLFK